MIGRLASPPQPVAAGASIGAALLSLLLVRLGAPALVCLASAAVALTLAVALAIPRIPRTVSFLLLIAAFGLALAGGAWAPCSSSASRPCSSPRSAGRTSPCGSRPS